MILSVMFQMLFVIKQLSVRMQYQCKSYFYITYSGYTAFQISAWRPSSHILAFSPNKECWLCLTYCGVLKLVFMTETTLLTKRSKEVNQIAEDRGVLKKGFYYKLKFNTC